MWQEDFWSYLNDACGWVGSVLAILRNWIALRNGNHIGRSLLWIFVRLDWHIKQYSSDDRGEDKELVSWETAIYWRARTTLVNGNAQMRDGMDKNSSFTYVGLPR